MKTLLLAASFVFAASAQITIEAPSMRSAFASCADGPLTECQPNSGPAWQIQGPLLPPTAGINNHRLIGDWKNPGGTGLQNFYASLSGGGKPYRFGGTFEWVPNPRCAKCTGDARFVISEANANPDELLANLINFSFSRTEGGVALREGNGSFVAPAACVGSGAYPQLQIGVAYSIWMIVSGESIYLKLPDDSWQVCTDPLIGRVQTNTTYWQIVDSSANGTYGAWLSVERTVSVDLTAPKVPGKALPF